MNTKLTLRLDDSLITNAKTYAAKEGRSVSDLVAAYFAALGKNSPGLAAPAAARTSKTDQLVGALAGLKLDEQDYKKHLEAKYQ
jgi:Family of unknown function (DUF6364)